MRVLALLHMAVPVHNAGAETHAHAMLRALVDAGHDVVVQLSQPTQADYTVDGVAVFGRKHKSDPFSHPNIDVILTHLENTPRATVIGEMTGTPVVHLCHNDMAATARWLGRRGVGLAVFNSAWMAESLRAQSGYSGPAVVVHPYPDPAQYATTPGDRVTLVNCWPAKGGDVLAALARRMPDVAFLAVEGAYGEPQVLPDLPNVDVVRHTPHVRDEVLARTRILLMPSEYESFGRIGAEAMTCGIPVIAHPTPGLLENLDSAGVFVDRDDIDGWVTAIRRLSKPRAWAAASRSALARSSEQSAARPQELAAFVAAVESLARHRRSV